MRITHTLTLFILLVTASSLLCAADDVPLQEITVRQGDTLWSVSNNYLKDPTRWPEIIKYNKIDSSDPNVILPGMVLKVPVTLIKENLRHAELVSLLNDVRYRRKNEGAFTRAILNMKLYNDDALRTFKESQAQIKFYSGELLRIDENSFIKIRPEEKQEEVNLLAGAVRASRSRVITANSVIMPKVNPKSAKSDFKTRLKEDKTTLVEVYEGIVDVTAQGHTVTLTKGFGTEVKYLKAPSPPKQLPPLPEMLNERLPGTDITAQLKLSSQKLVINLKSPDTDTGSTGKAKVLGQLINQYHLQVSSDNEFKTIIIDEINPLGKKLNVDFSSTKIPDGSYYYRIAYMDELGFEGQYTQPKIFTIDQSPPALTILKPAEGEFIQDTFIQIIGKTEPGCYVNINDRNIVVERDGSFQASISSKKKEVILNITSEDSNGNTSEMKRSVIFLAGKNKGDSFFSKPASMLMGFISISVIVGVIVLIL
ncbi:MAG: LysM peptidoglycan-binding domain-containing protein [bacterium]